MQEELDMCIVVGINLQDQPELKSCNRTGALFLLALSPGHNFSSPQNSPLRLAAWQTISPHCLSLMQAKSVGLNKFAALLDTVASAGSRLAGLLASSLLLRAQISQLAGRAGECVRLQAAKR